jgi:hypothetical protein
VVGISLIWSKSCRSIGRMMMMLWRYYGFLAFLYCSWRIWFSSFIFVWWTF